MSKRQCLILLPWLDSRMNIEDICSTECLRAAPHRDGRHVFKTPDGRYMAWQDDYSCDCCGVDDDEAGDRCFIFVEITEQEALELIARRD